LRVALAKVSMSWVRTAVRSWVEPGRAGDAHTSRPAETDARTPNPSDRSGGHAGHAFVQNLRRGHYDIELGTQPATRLAAAFNELAQAI
jgi:hypothetical protein